MRGFGLRDFSECAKRYGVTLDMLRQYYHDNGRLVGSVQQYAEGLKSKWVTGIKNKFCDVDFQEKIEFFIGCRVNGAAVSSHLFLLLEFSISTSARCLFVERYVPMSRIICPSYLLFRWATLIRT